MWWILLMAGVLPAEICVQYPGVALCARLNQCEGRLIRGFNCIYLNAVRW